MVDFSLPDDHVILASKVEKFIADEIVPLERDPRQGPHGPEESLRLAMNCRHNTAGQSPAGQASRVQKLPTQGSDGR